MITPSSSSSSSTLCQSAKGGSHRSGYDIQSHVLYQCCGSRCDPCCPWPWNVPDAVWGGGLRLPGAHRWEHHDRFSLVPCSNVQYWHVDIIPLPFFFQLLISKPRYIPRYVVVDLTHYSQFKFDIVLGVLLNVVSYQQPILLAASHHWNHCWNRCHVLLCFGAL